MKYIINESRLDDIVTKYISKTIGEYKELHGEERYSPPPFKSSLDYYAGFYKYGEYTAIITTQTLVINSSYYKSIGKLFGINTFKVDRILLDFVNQYDHPLEIRYVSDIPIRD